MPLPPEAALPGRCAGCGKEEEEEEVVVGALREVGREGAAYEVGRGGGRGAVWAGRNGYW